VLGVTDSVGGDELQFRAAGLAAMAAAARADQDRASSRARQAAASLERMREAWTREHAAPYERRRDIQRILSAVQRIVSSSVGRAGS
jgi:hypothetical protein